MPNIANILGNLLTDSGVDISTLPSGSGTTNYLPKWTGSTALGNSLVFDNGTSVGIGTTSPAYKLDVSGTGRFTQTTYITGGGLQVLGGMSSPTGNGGFELEYSAGIAYITAYNRTSFSWVPIDIRSSQTTFSTSGTEKMRLTSAGRLLIGTTTESTYELDVVGDIRSTLDANINGLTVGKGGGSQSSNTVLGSGALASNTTGDFNVAIGTNALNLNTTTGQNVAVGRASMQSATASLSVAIGTNAMNSAGSGTLNVAVGQDALRSSSASSRTTAIGSSSAYNTTGNFNTAVGNEALYSNTSGVNQVAVGMRSLYFATGGNNIGVGYNGGYDITTGTYNTIIGSGATGNGITTGNYNTIIGSQITGLSASLSNTIILADGQGNQRLYINNSGQSYIKGDGTSLNIHNSGGTGYNFVMSSDYSYDPFIQMSWGSGLNPLSPTRNNFLEVGSENYKIIARGSQVLRFHTQATERATIFTNGNFAIGTTTDAGYKLDVNGTFRAQSINTALSAGTQYVNFASANALFNTNSSSYSFAFWNGSNSFTIASDKVATLRRFDFLGQSTDPVAGLYGTYFNTTDNQLKTYTSAGWKFIPFEDSNHNYITSGGGYFGNTTTDASAILSATSTTKGFLPPRMTGTQAEAITTPADGLLVYINNGDGVTITSTGFWGRDAGVWVKLN